MISCSKCHKEFRPGTMGWVARLEGSPGGIGPEDHIKTLVLCPQDYAALPAVRRGMWHEYLNPHPGGPTREKRPGHLGGAP